MMYVTFILIMPSGAGFFSSTQSTLRAVAYVLTAELRFRTVSTV